MKNFLLLVTSVVFITSCGGGGGGGGSTEVPAPLSVTVSISSSDSSVQINSKVTLTWNSTLATSCSAGGSWTGSKATSGSEEVTIASTGSNSFSLTCSGTGITSGTGSAAVDGFRLFGGKVIDGYLRGATIYVDTNSNYSNDSNEPSVTSDNAGSFSGLKYANGVLVSEGGFDLDTSVQLESLQLLNKLSGYTESKVITPITTIAALMTAPENINVILGVDSTIDLSITDPIPSLGGSAYDNIYEKGNQLSVIALSLQNSMNSINSTTDNTKDYFESIAEELEKSFAALAAPGLVDIESEVFLSAVVDNVATKKASSIITANKNNLITAITSVIPLIQVKASSATTTAIQNFAFSTLQTDIQSIATGEATDEVITSYISGITTYIASNQNITATDLEIDITAQIDEITLSEDASAEISPLANDSYLRGQAVTVTLSTNPANGTVSIVGNTLSYTPNVNWNGVESFQYLISQGSKSSIGVIEVTVTAVNDAPVISSSSAISINEAISSVTTIAATDVDDDPITFSLSGTDAGLFAISTSGSLVFNTAPDFENPADDGTDNIYNITVVASDGTESVELAMVINVVNTAEESNPPRITLRSYQPTSIDVTTESKSVVIKLQVTDESDVVISVWNARLSLSGSPTIPDNVFERGASNSWVLESGNARDGIYSATIEVPAGSIAGRYDIEGGFWEDIHGNTANYWSAFDNGQVVTIINSP